MSRVVRLQSAARERRKLLQSLALVVLASKERELDKTESGDMLAFTRQVLDEIADSVKATVIAWEKRGYWIKADRFMAEWAWVERMRIKVEAALERSEDWPDPKLHHQLEQHLGDVTLPARMRNKRPWIGEGKSAEQNP